VLLPYTQCFLLQFIVCIIMIHSYNYTKVISIATLVWIKLYIDRVCNVLCVIPNDRNMEVKERAHIILKHYIQQEWKHLFRKEINEVQGEGAVYKLLLVYYFYVLLYALQSILSHPTSNNLFCTEA